MAYTVNEDVVEEVILWKDFWELNPWLLNVAWFLVIAIFLLGCFIVVGLWILVAVGKMFQKGDGTASRTLVQNAVAISMVPGKKAKAMAVVYAIAKSGSKAFSKDRREKAAVHLKSGFNKTKEFVSPMYVRVKKWLGEKLSAISVRVKTWWTKNITKENILVAAERLRKVVREFKYPTYTSYPPFMP